MADHLRTELALDALALALHARRPAPGLAHHTDRGCQYTAAAYRQALAARGVVASMSRSGDCLDNAMAESFFATLKAELIDACSWPTRAAARTAIFEWIEVFYNRQRAHSALAYRPPAIFEEVLLLSCPAAWRYAVCRGEATAGGCALAIVDSFHGTIVPRIPVSMNVTQAHHRHHPQLRTCPSHRTWPKSSLHAKQSTRVPLRARSAV